MSLIEKLVKWARIRSPWIIHFNTGGCNGCDIELLDTLTPRYDVERLGAQVKGSPRHGDILVVTGPVTRQTYKRLRRIYEQMPEPKFVVAVGTCACSGGVYMAGVPGKKGISLGRPSCFVYGGVDKVLPVDVYIPGCPPKPEAIIDGIVKLIQKLEKGEVE